MLINFISGLKLVFFFRIKYCRLRFSKTLPYQLLITNKYNFRKIENKYFQVITILSIQYDIHIYLYAVNTVQNCTSKICVTS